MTKGILYSVFVTLCCCFTFNAALGSAPSLEKALGGELFLENMEGADFGRKLQAAIDLLPIQGGLINCRGLVGEQSMDVPITIDKPARILLGQVILSFDNAEGQNMFNIASDGVDIIGLGRSVNAKKRSGKTVLKMLNSAGDKLGGYHIYNRGYASVSIKDLDMEGRQTTMEHQFMSRDKPLDGAGGIYMERAAPGGGAQSGNNISQIILENLYIEKTKAHGIYFDTPMLSTISNVRISQAGGHGVFIYRGTSCQLQSVYVSSANYAGFVFFQHAYSSVLNSVAENCAMGWWFRSSKNITALSPGVEETKNVGLPWGTSAPYGLNLKTPMENGTWFGIKDINADAAREFVGHGFYVSGGQSITIIGLYCKDPGSAKEADDAFKSTETRFLKVTANNRASSFSGLTLSLNAKRTLINDFDVEIGPDVEDCRLEWNPERYGLVKPSVQGQYISRLKSQKAPLLLRSTSTQLVSGHTAFTPLVTP